MVAIEENLGRSKQSQDWNIGSILITEDHVKVGVLDTYDKRQIDSTDNRKEDIKPIEKSSWEEVTVHNNVECTYISSLLVNTNHLLSHQMPLHHDAK